MGRHQRGGRRRADQRAAEGLEQHALRGDGVNIELSVAFGAIGEGGTVGRERERRDDGRLRVGDRLVEIARGCRFESAVSIESPDQISLARKLLYSQPGPVLIRARVDTKELDRVLPERDGVILARRFTERLYASME